MINQEFVWCVHQYNSAEKVVLSTLTGDIDWTI